MTGAVSIPFGSTGNGEDAFAGATTGQKTLKSLTIIEASTMCPKKVTPRMRVRTHPGEILAAEYLEPLKMSARVLAVAIGVPPNRLTEIVAGRRSITADTAIRLGRYFKTDPRFWLNLQIAHDLSKAEAETDYSDVPTRAA